MDLPKNDLIGTLKMAQDHLGSEGVINVLTEATMAKIGDARTSFIITLVCETVGLRILDFNNHKIRDDKRKACVCMVIYLMHDFLQLSHPDISKRLPFNIGSEGIRKYYVAFKETKFKNPKSDIDKIISNYKENLESCTREFISNKK